MKTLVEEEGINCSRLISHRFRQNLETSRRCSTAFSFLPAGIDRVRPTFPSSFTRLRKPFPQLLPDCFGLTTSPAFETPPQRDIGVCAIRRGARAYLAAWRWGISATVLPALPWCTGQLLCCQVFQGDVKIPVQYWFKKMAGHRSRCFHEKCIWELNGDFWSLLLTLAFDIYLKLTYRAYLKWIIAMNLVFVWRLWMRAINKKINFFSNQSYGHRSL